jgi:Flp pilus assembly protein TadD
LLNAGDLNGAIAELSRAASIDPKSGEAKNLLGIAYESKGLRQRALDSFKAAVEADKNNPEYLNNYGYLLYQNHDYDDATKYLKRAAKLSPDDPRIWNNLGLAQCRRGKFDDAFQSFVRAGGDFSGHVNIASQLMAQGQAKEAIKHLEKAQALQPNSTDVLAKLVSLYELTGRISDAEEARRSIVALRTFAEANK